ncbi:MAG: aminopeptidase P family protein [Gammaproteobacteria bacterium]|nr:aminopeptidase P family protein [Gammaproteobacteria bacterium]
MKDNWHYRAFTLQEHQSRLKRAQALMQENDIAVCICASPELIYYFSGYDAHTHHAIGSQALILPADGHEPTLILRDGDEPQADETLVLGSVQLFRLGAVDLATLVGRCISNLGLERSAIGMDMSGPVMNAVLADQIRSVLDRCNFIDCWRLLGKLRTVMSEQEIRYLEEAADYASIGIDTFYDKVRTGMSEIELAAEIEYAMRSAGSDYFAVPTWMASGSRAHCQHAMASPRILKPRDLVHAEFSGVARRYQCVTMGSLTLGEPSARMKEMAQGGIDAFFAGLDAAKVGGRIGDMELAYHKALNEQGLGDCCPMRFGVGISAAYPPVWENQITIQYECDDLLEPDMAFYIHSSMQSLEDKNGMLLGGSYLMTATGPERLDKSLIELVIVDT